MNSVHRSDVLDRRTFHRTSLGIIAAIVMPASMKSVFAEDEAPRIETVEGNRSAADLGITLPHEHVMVDFVGADQVSKSRYDVDEVARKVEPYLTRLKELGCKTLVECTPAYLGRDPALLRKLSQATGVQMLTNTGYYGAANGKYLPKHAHEESAEQLAARWIQESRGSIEDTGIKPGFIKIGVDAGPLTEVNRKLVQAAARTHLETGLRIAAHTGDGTAARQQLEILRVEGTKPESWIWVHAQVENDPSIHREVAAEGAWVEFDGIAPDSIDRHIELLQNMKQHQLLGRVLISHDAGWYWVGEPDGGTFRPYDTLFTLFLPALRNAQFTDEEIEQLLIHNPAAAFSIVGK